MTIDDPIAAFRSSEARLFSRYRVDPVERRVALGDPNIDARVLVSGEGPPLLHVHGGGAFGALWAPLAGALPGRRHIMPDRPGFVLTPRVELEGVDFRQHAVTFLSRLLDRLELERVDIVANSMGALWSLWLALDAPDRVQSLALLGAPALTGGGGGPLPMRLLGRPGIGRLMMALEPPSPKQVRTLWQRMGTDPDRLDATVLDVMLAAERVPVYGVAWRALMARIFTWTGVSPDCALPLEALAGVRCRTLFAWGKTDPFGDTALGERLAKATPDARFVSLDGGHLPWLDDTARCAQEVAAFLSPRLQSAPEKKE